MSFDGFDFVVVRPAVYFFDIQVVMVKWPDDIDIDSKDMKLYIIQWPWQWFVNKLINHAKKTLVDNYRNKYGRRW